MQTIKRLLFKKKKRAELFVATNTSDHSTFGEIENGTEGFRARLRTCCHGQHRVCPNHRREQNNYLKWSRNYESTELLQDSDGVLDYRKQASGDFCCEFCCLLSFVLFLILNPNSTDESSLSCCGLQHRVQRVYRRERCNALGGQICGCKGH